MSSAIIAIAFLIGGIALGIIAVLFGSQQIFRAADRIAPSLWNDRQGAVVVFAIAAILIAIFAALHR